MPHTIRRRPKTLMFRDDGTVPNNPDVPVLYYPQVLDLTRADDPQFLTVAITSFLGSRD